MPATRSPSDAVRRFASAARPGVDSTSARLAPSLSTSAGSFAIVPAPKTTRAGCET
jgi:hypothetical protein